MGKQNHLNDYERSQLREPFDRYCENYRAMIKPPVDLADADNVRAFLNSLMSEDFWKAMRVVEEYVNQNTMHRVDIILDPYKIAFKGPYGLWYRMQAAPVILSTRTDYAEWASFAAEAMLRGKEIWRVQRFLDTVMATCNTPGQMVRVWPEIATWLPPNAVGILKNMERKARPPKGLNIHDEEFLEARDFVNKMIPRMMLAPERSKDMEVEVVVELKST